MGRPHQKHSGHHALNQDHKNGVAEILVQNCEKRHHDRNDQDKKDCGAALAVRLLVETSKVNQPEQQQQNRRPVASQHRYELQKCTDDKNEHCDCQRLLHRQRAGTGDQKLCRKQWPKEGDDCPRIDQPGKADRNGKRYAQTLALYINAVLLVRKMLVS